MVASLRVRVGSAGGRHLLSFAPMRSTIAAPLAWLLTTGCLPDNPSVADGQADAGSDAETGGTDGDARVEDGLLGCPSGESCTIIALSQTIDDRVELFSAAGPGARYRGALDLDLQPNSGGDISGDQLDEPYGLAWDGQDLHVLVGHYPTRQRGSLLSFPAGSLAEFAQGSLVANSEWFAGGTSTTLGVRLTPLEREEPLSMVVHPPTGELLIAAFNNDLLVPDVGWTTSSELLRLNPAASSSPRATELDCAGAWSIVALDHDADAVAFACDGDESVVIVDSSTLANGEAPIARCVADIPFADKRVRYLAPDGLGGVIVGESPPIVSASEDARMWWFDGDCELRGFTVLEGATSWELRELVLVPADSDPDSDPGSDPASDPDAGDPRWLLARADGDERGVVILAGDPSDGTITPCGRVDALDQVGAWTAKGGDSPLRPHALALTRDGHGLAVGVGPATYANAGPGYGSLWWVEFDDPQDACELSALETVELGAAAPAVDPDLPQTWRRAPDAIEIIEVGP